jgi:protein-S-isoprenylcysteine O-methyltransferase Ste14
MYAAALLASIAAWAIAEAAATPDEPHARLPREVATGVALLAVHAAALIEHLARDTAGSLAGLAVIAAGLALRLAAIRALGSRFVSSPGIDRVIATGPYRVMRHPSELGLLAAAAGAAWLMGSCVAALITAGVLLPLCVWRCREEDRLLAIWS